MAEALMAHAELERLREQVTEIDRELVDAVNRRLDLVTRIRRYKREHGLPLLDLAREEQLLRHLADTNAGPLSEAGLRRLHAEILGLTKRELGLDVDA
jgi:chorismate mutase